MLKHNKGNCRLKHMLGELKAHEAEEECLISQLNEADEKRRTLLRNTRKGWKKDLKVVEEDIQELRTKLEQTRHSISHFQRESQAERYMDVFRYYRKG